MEKANIFNDFFSRQCQPKSSDSTVLLTFSFQTTNQLSNVNIGPEMCGSSIIKPLQLLFNNCVKQGVYPNIWKLANVLPVQKKKKEKKKRKKTNSLQQTTCLFFTIKFVNWLTFFP